jgi:hypothetical protein
MCLYWYNCGIVGSRGRISNVEEGAQNDDREDGVLGPSSSPAGGLEGHGCGGKNGHKNKNVFGGAEGKKGTAKELLLFPSPPGESDCGSAVRLMLVGRTARVASQMEI